MVLVIILIAAEINDHRDRGHGWTGVKIRERGDSPAYDLGGWPTATSLGVSQEFCMDGPCWMGV